MGAGELTGRVLHFLVATVVFSAAYGLCVAIVVMRLDNVVKYHLSATSSVLNTFASAVLFPDKFRVTPAYVISLAVLLVAIYLYEKKSFVLPDCLGRWRQDSPKSTGLALASVAGYEPDEDVDDKTPLV